MALREVKQELQKFDKKQLIELISNLYKNQKAVKEQLDLLVMPDEKPLLEKYRKDLYKLFFGKSDHDFFNGNYPKLGEARKTVNAFRKTGAGGETQANLMLYYVELGVDFTNQFGDINEQFYISIEKMFESALTLMQKEHLLENFKHRARQVVIDTSGIGWGFHDTLSEIYSEYYAEE